MTPQSFSDYSSRQGTLLSVSRTTCLARGVVTHPGRVAKGVILLPSRGLGSRTIRRPMRLRSHHIANTETISRVTRNIFVMLLWLFAGLHHKNVSSRLQYSAQPSPKRLLVFEAANIIDESSTTYSVCHGRRIISSTGRTYCRLPAVEATLQAAGKVVHQAMVLRSPFGFVWVFLPPGEGLSSTQEDWALGRFIYQWTIHCCYCWSFCVLATTISFWHLSSLPQRFVRPLISRGGGG